MNAQDMVLLQEKNAQRLEELTAVKNDLAKKHNLVAAELDRVKKSAISTETQGRIKIFLDDLKSLFREVFLLEKKARDSYELNPIQTKNCLNRVQVALDEIYDILEDTATYLLKTITMETEA